MTSLTLISAIKDLDFAFDAVAPIAGIGELQPLADALAALLEKVTTTIANKQNPLAAEVQAADVAADAAEVQKFGK